MHTVRQGMARQGKARQDKARTNKAKGQYIAKTHNKNANSQDIGYCFKFVTKTAKMTV